MLSSIAILLLAWLIEAIFGWPEWLYRRIKHPVVWCGWLITLLNCRLNKSTASKARRTVYGALTALIVIAAAVAVGISIMWLLPETPVGSLLAAVFASSMLASQSLYRHVDAVYQLLEAQDLNAARVALSHIVGRETARLDEHGVSRAAIESLAENTSDGVTAPLFWGALFGLPGIMGYKAINTLDSMIGHKNERYRAFGCFAARLDDVANLIPARLTGALFSLVSGKKRSWYVMWADAGKHLSPNAGWPEAAMAGALNVSLGGPKSYAASAKAADQAWLHFKGTPPVTKDIARGLKLYQHSLLCLALLLLGAVIVGRYTSA